MCAKLSNITKRRTDLPSYFGQSHASPGGRRCRAEKGAKQLVCRGNIDPRSLLFATKSIHAEPERPTKIDVLGERPGRHFKGSAVNVNLGRPSGHVEGFLTGQSTGCSRERKG